MESPLLDALLTDGPTRIMAILNSTPDSFSHDVHASITQAIEAGIEMAEQGGDIIDVGGESTRPGAERIDEAEESARVIPVIHALASAGIAVSVDTVRANIAEAAIDAGAILVNDVSGGLADPRILKVAAEANVGYVLQHWRTPFDHRPTHTNVVSEVCTELTERAQRALDAGISPDRLILDPGIGFGKTNPQNWELIRHADKIATLGYKVLWGVSRKRFLADVFPHPTHPWQRDQATQSLVPYLSTAWALRIHTVPPIRTALAVAHVLNPICARLCRQNDPKTRHNLAQIDLADVRRMETLDRMEVRGVEAWGYHGVFDQERREGQPFLVDLTWWADVSGAASSDDLRQAVDYGEMSSRVIELLQGEPVDLIETLGYRILTTILSDYDVEYAGVSVHKPQAPLSVGFTDVVLSIVAGRTRSYRQVVFSLGSNIEPSQDHLQFGVTALASTEGIRAVRVSEIYRTAPQSSVNQPDFYNVVLIAESNLPARKLLARALEIETTCHRTREVHHGPRTLDIDIIDVDGETWNNSDLILPHPRAHHRAFVLIPWISIDPDARLNSTLIRDFAQEVQDQGVYPTDRILFLP